MCTEIVYASVKNSAQQQITKTDKPLIERKMTINAKGEKQEKVTVNVPGKPQNVTIGYKKTGDRNDFKFWFYINNKLYSEADAEKFDAEFIKKLPITNGSSVAKDYVIAGLPSTFGNWVFWFGTEPKFSATNLRNRAIYTKYNNTTVTGKVLGFTHAKNAKTMVDGFLIKTTAGDTLAANIESKFTKEISAMVSVGTDMTIKIYNANYQEGSNFPVVGSYKLMKNGKVLFDRWPKKAVKSIIADKKVNVAQLQAIQMVSNPILTSSSSLRMDIKKGISYVVDGKYNIGGVLLEGKESTFDQTKNTIKALKATITKNGHMIVSDEIIVDVNANYFTVKEIKEPFRLSTFSKIDQGYLDIGYAKKVKYAATDSININRRDEIITLYGNATIANEKMKFKGSEIIYDGKLNKAVVKNAIYYDNEVIGTSDLMEVDFNTSKVISKKGVLKMNWK